jgi:hypothetical protein
MILQAKVLFYLAMVSLALMFMFLLPCFSKGWKRFLYK